MKANYTEYMKLFNKLYVGVPLTDDRLSDNALQIASYLRDGGASDIMKKVYIGLRHHRENDRPIKTELVYIDGEYAGRALNLREIENIGILLLMYWKEIK